MEQDNLNFTKDDFAEYHLLMRQAAGLTQRQLAKKLLVKQPDICKFERAQKMPTDTELYLTRFQNVIKETIKEKREYRRKRHGIVSN